MPDLNNQSTNPPVADNTTDASAESITVSKAEYDRLTSELTQRSTQLNDVINKNNQLINMMDKSNTSATNEDEEFLKELFGESVPATESATTPPPVNQAVIKKLYEENRKREQDLVTKTDELNRRTIELSRQQELAELTTLYPNLGNIRNELQPLIQQYPDVSPKVLMHVMLGQKVLENPDLHTYIVNPKQLTETKQQLETLRKQVPPQPQHNGVHIGYTPITPATKDDKPFSMRSAVSQVVQDLYNKGV